MKKTPTGTKGCASHVGAGCTFCPGWCYQPGQKLFVLVARPGTKVPLLSRPGVPGWKTGTIKVSQPRQISISVVLSGTGERPCLSHTRPRRTASGVYTQEGFFVVVKHTDAGVEHGRHFDHQPRLASCV